MKILRKGDNFKKMPDSNISEVAKIQNMIEQGWRYVCKKEYKDFFYGDTVEKEEKKSKKSK